MYRQSGRDDGAVPSPLPVPRSLRWPKRCVKCGTPDDTEKHSYRFEREPPFLAALIPLTGVIPYLLVRRMFARTDLSLRFCPPCHHRFRDARSAEYGIRGGASVMLVVCVACAANEAWLATALVGLLGAAALVAIHRRLVAGRTIALRKVRGDLLFLAGLHASVGRAILETPRRLPESG